jgi:hypothetical protein
MTKFISHGIHRSPVKTPCSPVVHCITRRSPRVLLHGCAVMFPCTRCCLTQCPAAACAPWRLQGTQNWLHLGVESYSLWWQSVVDGIANDDQTGLTAEQEPRKARRFGEGAGLGGSSSSTAAAGLHLAGCQEPLLIIAHTCAAFSAAALAVLRPQHVLLLAGSWQMQLQHPLLC